MFNIASIAAAASSSFDFGKFFNLQGVSSGDTTSVIKAVAVLVLNIFLTTITVIAQIIKLILGLIH